MNANYNFDFFGYKIRICLQICFFVLFNDSGSIAQRCRKKSSKKKLFFFSIFFLWLFFFSWHRRYHGTAHFVGLYTAAFANSHRTHSLQQGLPFEICRGAFNRSPGVLEESTRRAIQRIYNRT